MGWGFLLRLRPCWGHSTPSGGKRRFPSMERSTATARSEAETPRTERQLRWRTTAGAEWTKVRTGTELPRLPWRETSTLPRILKHPLCKRRQESFLAAHSADAFQDSGPPTRILEFNNKQTGHWSRVLRGQKY